ncbi:glycoside hydrolase family 105 protein [Mucilaginibacter sp.]|jgi:rhamnogalacturonyl hydrolase YesR|uniref:glycoside hydrolase family 88/105 protein n=1 Tax=Mucilaginibacter sp. TaxID=1882438 RepID=UPI0035661DFF
MKKYNIKIWIFSGIGLISSLTVCAQPSLNNWPEEAKPQLIGKQIVERYLDKPYVTFGPTLAYADVCTWHGALDFARLSQDTSLRNRLIERFYPLLAGSSAIMPAHDNVDHSVFGAIPLQLYMLTGIKSYLSIGQSYAEHQWEIPPKSVISTETSDFIKKGFSWQTRLWIDDMYMITMLQIQAYRATKQKTYLDRAVKEMVFYLKELQKPNGLFYHAPDAPFFWGRGNGWMAAGMTELLCALPKNDPDRQFILKSYRIMMSSLLNYQKPSGMWGQLIDDPESWEESSCTGMFTYAMITGVKNKWLTEKLYGPAARKAWLVLVAKINLDHDVTEVCIGTNKKNDRQYYLDRKRITGDLHGQAPVLWCAAALLK